MTQSEYEQKRRECLKEFCKQYKIEEANENIIDTFNWVFDLAYVIGKQEKEAEGEDKMLMVSREKLKETFETAKKIGSSKMSSKMLAGAADMLCNTLEDLFGSKGCL